MNYFTIISFLSAISACNGLATIGVTIQNASVFLGEDAQFFCEIIGTQGVGESLTFNKNTPTPAIVISEDEQVINATKHVITGKYNLTVKATTFSDQGQYECSFGATEFTAYLTVSDPPESSKIYWGEDNKSYTKAGEAANLTCESGRSYPPATFRWFQGDNELTENAVYANEEDAEGYGKAYSYLELTPSNSDEGTEYKCYVDIPAESRYFTEKISVSFSGVGQLMASISVITAAAFFALKI